MRRRCGGCGITSGGAAGVGGGVCVVKRWGIPASRARRRSEQIRPGPWGPWRMSSLPEGTLGPTSCRATRAAAHEQEVLPTAAGNRNIPGHGHMGDRRLLGSRFNKKGRPWAAFTVLLCRSLCVLDQLPGDGVTRIRRNVSPSEMGAVVLGVPTTSRRRSRGTFGQCDRWFDG
jgi:hypothetical protein